MSAIEDPAQPQSQDQTTPHFGVTVDVSGIRATLRPHGEVDVATTPAIERHAHALWAEGAELIVLDLGAVSFFDSSGLRLLIRLDDHAAGDPTRSFALGPCAPAVERILELTRLSARFARV